MTKVQKIAAAAALILAIFTAVYQGKRARDGRGELQKLQTEQASLTKETNDLQADVASMTNQLAMLQAKNSALEKTGDGTELLQLRDQVAQLRPLQDEVAAMQKTLKQSSAGLAHWKTNELANAGYAAPFDALQTFLYSSQPDPPKITNCFVGDDVDPPSEDALQKFIKLKTEHQRGLIDMGIIGYKVLSQNWLTADKVRVEVEVISPDGVGVVLPITLRKINDEWKLVVFNIRDRHGAVNDVQLINTAPYQ